MSESWEQKYEELFQELEITKQDRDTLQESADEYERMLFISKPSFSVFFF